MSGDGIRIGSMCSGYGGLDMAVTAVFGGDVAWVADPDPAASALLAHHQPGIPNLGDITAADFTQVEPVDIVCAGFPCQSVSLAGSRAGLVADAASGLWSHVAVGIAALRPPLVVIENVGGLRSARADSNVEPCPWCLGDPDDEPHLRALGAVLGDLATLGFDAEWTSLRASDIGAAHQRERVFILAWPADPKGPRLQGPRLPGRSPVRDRTAADPDGLGDERDRPARQPAQRHPARPSGAAAHPAGLGTGEPADQALTLAGSGQARPEPGRRSGHPAADTASDGRHQGRPEPAGIIGGPDAALSGPAQWGRYAPAIARWETILSRPAPRPTDDRRRLNPAFVEWLMGLPASHVTGVPGLTRNQMLKLLGNGVLPHQGTAAIRALVAAATGDRTEAA